MVWKEKCVWWESYCDIMSRGRLANWNSITARTIPSVSWILSDNLPAFCGLSDLIKFFQVHVSRIFHTRIWTHQTIKPFNSRLIEHLLSRHQCLFQGTLCVWLCTTVRLRKVDLSISSPCVCVKVPLCLPYTLPVCSRLVTAQCQCADVWPLSFQQEFIWNL